MPPCSSRAPRSLVPLLSLGLALVGCGEATPLPSSDDARWGDEARGDVLDGDALGGDVEFGGDEALVGGDGVAPDGGDEHRLPGDDDLVPGDVPQAGDEPHGDVPPGGDQPPAGDTLWGDSIADDGSFTPGDTFIGGDNQTGGDTAAPGGDQGLAGDAEQDDCAVDNGGCGNATYYRCTDNLGGPPTCAEIGTAVTPVAQNFMTRFALDLYPLLLDRAPDAAGLRGHIANLFYGATRLDTLRDFTESTEFLNNPPLSAETYVDRLYRLILGREPDALGRAALIALIRPSTDPDYALSLLQAYDIIVYSEEYRGRCATEVFGYGRPVRPAGPRLADVVSGTARVETILEAQEVGLTFSSPTTSPQGPQFDKKLALFEDPASGEYHAITRLHQPLLDPAEIRYSLILLRSLDGGASFVEVGPLFDRSGGHPADTYYDAHLAIDYTVCPNQYILVYECHTATTEWFSACVSRTTDPANPDAWTPPQLLIEGCDADPGAGCSSAVAASASTPVILVDGTRTFVAWSVVEAVDMSSDSYIGRVYTRALEVSDLTSRAGYATDGVVLMDSELNEGNTDCSSAWDCANRNLMDWHADGGAFFGSYAGGNFFWCLRPAGDVRPNIWGIGVSHAPDTLAGYVPAAAPAIEADKLDYCAVTYNTVTSIDGELFVYFSAASTQRPAHALRSRIRWR